MKSVVTLTFSFLVFVVLIYITENLVSAHHLKEEPVVLVRSESTPFLSREENVSKQVDTCTEHIETLHTNIDNMNQDLDKIIQELKVAK